MSNQTLIVDEKNILFNVNGMRYIELESDYTKVRYYSSLIVKDAPEELKEENLLEQQISEIIKNAIKHGNKCDVNKKVRVWYDFTKKAKIIVEDEGEGFQNIDRWNQFNIERLECFENMDFENMEKYVAYKDENSDDTDGGNSLFGAIEYWNGGIIYNEKRNKLVAVRYYDVGDS